jgi:hypothetical protein
MGGSAPDFSGFQYQGPQPPPAPDPTQPADFSSFGPPITSSSMGSFASGAAPATFTGGPPAGTQDLENQIGPAQQNLGNALQNQQAQPQGQPGQQPGQGQAPNFQDPLGPMISDLVARHQQLMQQTQAPSPGSPVKNMLRNFFQGAGNAMMVDAGLPSPNMQRLQLEQQITSLSNARSLYMDRQAEAASRQMQLQMMNTPASPELASAIGTPQLAGTVIPPAYLPVISNENRGREAATIAAQQRQDQLDQNKITLPPTVITKAAASAAGYPELEGKTLTTPQDYATFEKLGQARGLQKFDTGQDGKGPGRGIWILDRVGNPVQQISPISETNRATKLATAGMGQVYALPPGTTNPVLTTMGAAQANGIQIVRPATPADNEKAINAHDKAYVQPAEQVEKSYQMMNQAYNEYQGAAAQGKDLPTGAQSMVALSTHLATTFGNVKGSRITKDMIQEHLGARSVSDAATVAIQKLTNGDVLSPAQWSAFHDLLSNSRNLSWKTATTEAQRKAIPTNFLPPDLANLGQANTAPSSPSSGFNWNALPKVQP